MRHNGDRSPDEILAGIERTRSELDSTLSAIEHRLTPGQLVDQGLDYLRSARTQDCHAACEVTRAGGRVAHTLIRCWQDDPARPIGVWRQSISSNIAFMAPPLPPIPGELRVRAGWRSPAYLPAKADCRRSA